MNDAIDLLDGNPATRSTDGRKVEEIIPVSGNVAWTTYGTVTHNYEFFHNNWGWEGSNIHGGDGNGYYIAGIFEGSRGPDLPSETRAGDGNFVYNLEMWTNIYPN